MYILFDIGGTKMRVAGSEDLVSFSEPKIIDTPIDFEEGLAELKKLVDEVSGGNKIKMAAGGVAGAFDKENNKLINSPHLHSWKDKEVKHELEKAFDCPVYVQNDSAVVGLGEAVYGAGKENDIVVYITISTGVGGARIVNGKIDVSTFGFEPGHQIIDIDSSVCPTCTEGKYEDGKGHLEAYVSGTSTENRFSKRAYEVTDKKVWDEIAKWLAYGLNNTIVHWSPDIVVLGGSMVVKEVGIKIPDVEKHLKSILKIFPEIPKIKQASLGDFGGMYGAMELIKQQNE